MTSSPAGPPFPPQPPPTSAAAIRPAPPTRRGAARIVAGLFWLAAAGLAVWATFTPFYRFTQDVGNGRIFEYAPSGWSWNLRASEDLGVSLGPPALYVIPLAVAAGVLLLAAVVAVTKSAAMRSAGLLGTGLLVGAMSMILVEALANQAASDPPEIVRETELGTWLLVGAAALAVLGTGFALARAASAGRPTAWPARVEPETPRFGVPMPPQDQPLPPSTFNP